MAKPRFPTPPPGHFHSPPRRDPPSEAAALADQVETPCYWVVARYAGRYSYLLGTGWRWLSRVGDGVWFFDSEVEAAKHEANANGHGDRVKRRRWVGKLLPGMIFMHSGEDE